MIAGHLDCLRFGVVRKVRSEADGGWETASNTELKSSVGMVSRLGLALLLVHLEMSSRLSLDARNLSLQQHLVAIA